MKSALIVIVVIILIVIGFMFMKGDSTTVNVTETTTPTPSPTPTTTTPTPSAQGSVKEFTVTGKNFSFSPATINVKKGDTVKITFINSEGFHDWKIDEFGAATKQIKAPGTEVLEFVATKSGTFEYYCSVGSHRAMGMVGKLVVE